jgi:regulator of sigma E protease
MDFLHTVFYFIVAIGILVSFHEFGHFWVARRCGVKVIRFSVGFGKVLWSYQKSPDSTQYVLSAIPLGGYVKMVDEREGEVGTDDLPFAFNRQSLWVRTAIVAAGPVFNLALAAVFFWSVLVIGESGIRPVLGKIEQSTIAAKSGFLEGDEIMAVDGQLTPTWTEAMNVLISKALDGDKAIDVTVKGADQLESTRKITVAEDDTQSPEVLYSRLGLKPWSPKLIPVIGDVLPDGAALAAGLQKGDLIISADGKPLQEWAQWVSYVKTHPGMVINLAIERAGVSKQLIVIPKSIPAGDKTEGQIGATVSVPEDLIKSMTVEYALSPLAAIPKALETTYYYSFTTLKMMGKMLIGKASVQNLSGPISIAQYAGQSANMGLVHFIKFMGLVSISLGVLNLLPIPVLDGGHLLFFAVEGIKGSPVSERVQLFFQQVGMTLLVSLMILAMVLDVQRLFD